MLTIPLQTVPRKMYTFQSNPRYTPENMFTNQSTTLHALHNWIELSSGTFPFFLPSLHTTDPPQPPEATSSPPPQAPTTSPSPTTSPLTAGTTARAT